MLRGEVFCIYGLAGSGIFFVALLDTGGSILLLGVSCWRLGFGGWQLVVSR